MSDHGASHVNVPALVQEITCDRGHVFEAPFPAGADYGTLFFRSAGLGNVVVFDTLENPVFNQVSMFAESSTEGRLSERQRGDLIQSLLGRTIDLDADGSAFGTDVPSKCTVCGSDRFRTWRVPDSPPRYLDLDWPTATHTTWGRLTAAETDRRTAGSNGSLSDRATT